VPSSYYAPDQVDIGFTADQSHALGYIPGDQLLDKYLYVYPDDETRRVSRKIGQGMGLTWSVAFDGQYIWTATVQGMVYKLNPVTGQILQQFASPGPQPWGMTFDGEHLWIVDFAEKRISEIDPANGTELKTFPTPDPVGGCKGVAWDGTYLNIMGWTSPTIYRMDLQGNLVRTIQLDRTAAGGIAWDGSHFWVPAGKIFKFDAQGRAVGWIYPASEGTWDMAWDGQYLWATQRTNENWLDAKIFALEILNVNSP
jgi:streptogramin lyase